MTRNRSFWAEGFPMVLIGVGSMWIAVGIGDFWIGAGVCVFGFGVAMALEVISDLLLGR